MVVEPLAKTASGTQIVYTNRSAKNVARITFTVFYQNAEHEFSRTIPDVGNFAPNATINHHFDLYNDVTYAGKAVSYCKATYVQFVDGTVWKA